jgi:2-polyprenyl-6-methoxyphenol hydroxylase-like FAD-dependent oxidoreductase
MNPVTFEAEAVADTYQTSCCIVGGGPAGMVLALLLARKGVPVTLLEAHHDFDRDFRGDTIHPATLEALDQLELADRLLQLPHGKLEAMQFSSNGKVTTLARFHRLKTRFPYIMILPQAKFLAFLAEEARRYPAFRLELGASVQRLVQEDGVTRGVRYRGVDDAWHEVRALLTVGADGRFSKVRSLCGAVPVKASPPMDVLWFRLPRRPGDPRDQITFYIGGGLFIFFLDRGNEWQVGYALTKGKFAETKAAGLDSLRTNLIRQVPWVAERAESLQDWKQIVVLSVESSRVPTWHQAGLLLIGDAAHVMSPVGGVGINYAIQDAIEAANVLATPLQTGQVTQAQLAEIQKRREPAVKSIQKFQGFVQDRVVKTALDKDRSFQLPWVARIVLKIPMLRDLPARLIAFGTRRARIQK